MPSEVNPSRPAIKASRTLRLLMATAALALGGAAIASAALIWRVSQGPLDAAPAIPFIERALEGSTGMDFQLGTMSVIWRGGANPLALDIGDISVTGEKGTFLSLTRAGITLSPLPLLLGKMDIANARIHDIKLRITRLPDGKITLTGSDTQSHTASSQALTLQDIAMRMPSIDVMILENASIVFEDQKDAIVRHFNHADLSMIQDGSDRERAITGYFTAPLTDHDNGGTIAVDFSYDASDHTLAAAAAINDADTRRLLGRTLWRAGLPMVDMQVDGRANIVLNNNFFLQDLSFRLKSDGGTLHWPRHFGEDMPIQKLTNFVLDLAFNPATQTLELRTAEITSKGLTVSAKGDLRSTNEWENLEGDLNVHIPVLAVDLLPEIWPQKWGSGARAWLVDKMNKGRFANINVHVPLSAIRSELTEDDSRKWNVRTGDVNADFNFTGITVDYNAPMLPAQSVTGTGTFKKHALTLDIGSAKTGNLKITDGRLFFDDLVTPGNGTAQLNFALNGPASAVFGYLEPEPISYRKKIGLDLSATTGTADLTVDVRFPTSGELHIDDVHVDVDAKLHNVQTPPVIKGLSLSGDAFDLKASQNHFILSGEGTLGGNAAKLTWHEIFDAKPGAAFATKLDIDLQTDSALRRIFIGALDDRITGPVPARLSMLTAPDGTSKLDATITLTPARLDLINPFNTVKQRGIDSVIKATATLKDGVIQSIDSLSATGAGLSIDSGNIDFRLNEKGEPAPAAATVKGAVLGQTQADISAIWQNPHTIRAEITGKAFDARYIMGNSEHAQDTIPGDSLAYDLTLKLDELYITDRPLKNVSAAFVGDTEGTYKTASMDADAGKGTITLRYGATGTPDDSLFLEIQDAGAGLRALGLNERVHGGYLRAEGTPMQGGNPGDMQGTLRLEDFSIRRAPTLAKLINMLSLPGILNLLNQETGLNFKRAEANVTLLNRDGGPTLMLRDGRTTGASLGLTFEGEVNTATEIMAVQGTVVPMSEINTAIASIPLIGDILTGGKLGSGIFAATYTMRGQTADPDVMVNPLSVLTPGILRRILFEGTLANDLPNQTQKP